MGEKKKKMVNTNLGILLICLFSSIFTMADFIIIDHVLDKYFDYSKCECSKCGDNNLKLDSNTDNISVVEEKSPNQIAYDDFFRNYVILDSDYNVRTTYEVMSVVKNELYADIKVVDGKLLLSVNRYTVSGNSNSDVRFVSKDESFDELDYTYSIPGENIKYIYCFSYQPAGTGRIYILTDENNLYMSSFSKLVSVDEFNLDNIVDFKMIDSNISEIKRMDNPDIANNSNCVDCLNYALFSVKEGNLIRLF